MYKKLLFLFSIACSIALLSLFTGCSDKDYYDNGKSDPTEKDEHSKLTFSTTKSIEFFLNYQVATGYVSTFDVYSEYPLDNDGVLKNDLKPITGGIHIAGVSKIKRVIPTYVKDLYLYSTDLFIPQLIHAKVNDDKGEASFAPMSINVANRTAPETRTIIGNNVDHYLKTKSDFYTENVYSGGVLIESKYDLKVPDKKIEIPAEILTSISQTFPDGQSVDEKYLKDAILEIKNEPGSEGAHIFVSVIHAGGSFNNSLSYFVYEGPKELKDLVYEERKNFELINIFQLADVHTNSIKDKNMGLTPGHYVQLKYKNAQNKYVNEFPTGAKIGWVLHSNGFNENSFTAEFPTFKIYSISAWNQSKYKRTIFFGATDKNMNQYYCFGFEDQLVNGDNDCNDVLFHVDVNPLSAVTPPPFIPSEVVITKDVAYKGILAFEDNWPRLGDYDLNDVVVKYNSTINYVQDGLTTESGGVTPTSEVTVKSTKDVFSFVHTGADFDNAFSYKVDIAPSKIASVKITDHENNPVTYTVKADGSGFVINLCPNVKDVIAPMTEIINPAVYTVEMEFVEKAVSESSFETVRIPYNPFIKPVNPTIASNRIEVHLPFYRPSAEADLSLFGTESDKSQPENNIYYVSGVNVHYPFALHLSEADQFKIPVEGKSIEYTYPKYTNWVENGCSTTFADWYLQ